MTETPAISWGYWKARNMPRWRALVGGELVTSSPLKSDLARR